MPNHSAAIVQKLWNYCDVLRDAGLSYGDYVEQLTFLLFLKMAHEQTQPPWNWPSPVPAEYAWPSLTALEGDALEKHYRKALEELGKRKGMLGAVFLKAQNKIQDPALLRRLIADLIDREQWMILDADVKGDAYEGLLEKNAQGVKANVLFFDRKPASEAPWTKLLWMYDLRTNKHFALRTNPLVQSDLDEFVKCYHPENRYDRKPTWTPEAPDGRWRAFPYEELLQRDKVSLDIFWLKDESLEESSNLPDPDIIAAEIVEDLRSALEQFEMITEDLNTQSAGP